jgi:hypothetical protein
MRWIWVAHDGGLLAADANRRAVALLFSLVRAVQLHQHGVIDVRAEGILDRIEVGFVPIPNWSRFCSGSSCPSRRHSSRSRRTESGRQVMFRRTWS